MKKKEKDRLMRKYNIKSVGGGTYGEGFFDCLKSIDGRNIDLFNNSHVLKRVEFAKENGLDYDWLINQLKNDWNRGIGIRKSSPKDKRGEKDG